MVLGRDFSNGQLVLMVVGVEKQNVIIRKSLFKQIEWIKGDMFNLIWRLFHSRFFDILKHESCFELHMIKRDDEMIFWGELQP